MDSLESDYPTLIYSLAVPKLEVAWWSGLELAHEGNGSGCIFMDFEFVSSFQSMVYSKTDATVTLELLLPNPERLIDGSVWPIICRSEIYYVIWSSKEL